MAYLDPYSSVIKRVTSLVAVVGLSGCALFPAELPVSTEAPDTAVILPAPVVEPTEPAAVKDAAPAVVNVAELLPSVAVVLSSRHPAYDKVAAALGQQLDNYTVFDLSDKSQSAVSAFHAIDDSDTSAVVAIGLRAAISATSMSRAPVVFCQVFNIQEYNLLTENSRGIAALPPLDLQIAAWKKIDPTLTSIGAILGTGHEDLIAEAKQAAAKHGIDLHIRKAKSDRETLYLFNRLVGEIDGFWLFPDNRILSTPILQEIMDYAVRHRVRVAVFSEPLLAMGATLSSTTLEADIADTVIQVLREIAAGNIDSVPPVSALSDVRIVTNKKLLQKLTQTGSPANTELMLASGQ